MELAVYAQGWYFRSLNYHPSRPPRRLKMAEDFSEYRASMLTWPSLGGGAISLPYLEQEADGHVPARYRLYGYVTDREFNEVLKQKGIKAYSVIFCTQGWEFPAELSEDEDEILALNELRGVGKRTWLGLREFTQNTYPKLWKPFESYFPDGLVNSDGERVTDLWEECASRDIHGNPLHADWLECPAREHICYYMDISNPVWREYLKAIIRIHIDSGVEGIQFDEPDSPISALRYGGCFCKDCMKGFTSHLQHLPEDRVPAPVRGQLGDFHYGRWLLDHGVDHVDAVEPDDLVREYMTYQRRRVAENFHELATYAREYAAQRGGTVLISANLFDGAPWHDPLVADVDVLVPEHRTTLYAQPVWTRYIAGFAGDKPTSVSMNPYGGQLPELAAEMALGRGTDRFRTMMYEASALGANMAVPYGAWMGSVIEDALYAPHEETKVIQNFLADHADLFSTRTFNDTAIVYSVESNFMRVTLSNHGKQDEETKGRGDLAAAPVTFVSSAEALVQALRPFDVVMYHDGDLRADDASAEQLAPYQEVVLPGCSALTGQQVDAVLDYLESGGRVLVVGELGTTAGDRDVRRILEHAGTVVVDGPALPESCFQRPPQLQSASKSPLGLNIQRTAAGTAALHVVNYDYDAAAERTVPLADMELGVRLPGPVSRARVSAPGEPDLELEVDSDEAYSRFTLPGLRNYAVVELLS